MKNKSNLILEVKGLKKYFPLSKDIFGHPTSQLRAVDDVSFSLVAGKTIGVVGESGCGKTTLGRTILQLYDTTGGRTLYYGHSIDEFLPKYYIEEVKKISSYASKYKKLKAKLDLLEVLKDKKDVILSDYISYLETVNNDLKSVSKEDNNEKYKLLSNIKNILDDFVILLENAAIISGGLLLTDNDRCSQLLLQKLYLNNKLLLDSSDSSIQSNLNLCSNELNEIKKSFLDNALFKDLESKIETGLDLARLTKKELRSLRTEIQLIFQDPYSSLPPRMTIGSILTEPVKVHKTVEKEEISNHVHKVMKMCGLQPQYYDRYPHEFSGGQRQRICIARALVVNPKLVICDEPVSALDVSIQAQIINLLKELQNNLGLTYMFISHDLSVVKYITDSIIVMYLGNMMEIGDTKDIFQNPLHPYTKALFSAVPVPDPDAKMNRIILKGDIPSPANPPKGCKFHTRCENCMNVCKIKAPKFIKYDDNHLVACHLYDNNIMDNLSKYDQEYFEYERQQKQIEEMLNQKKNRKEKENE